VPPPCIRAVSDADVRADAEVELMADAGAPGEGDGGAEAEADGDAEPEGGADAEGDGDAEEDGEAEGDGDALGCEDPAPVEAEPTTRWPAAICAEPVVTRTREPTEGGARSGAGARCPFMLPGATFARVADADT
jgi:hypothetical protein